MIRHLFRIVWNRRRANALVLLEIFGSFLVLTALLTTALVLLSNYRRPLGFSSAGVWVVKIDMKVIGDDFWTPEMAQNFDSLLREVRRLPGVRAAAGTMTPPYIFESDNTLIRANGRDVRLGFDEVTDGFAEVMKLRVVKGRWFRADDDAATFRPVVLDETAARALFGDDDPIGERFDREDRDEMRVIGVVSAYRKDGELAFPQNFVFKRVKAGDRNVRPPRELVLQVAPDVGPLFEQELVQHLRHVVPDYSYTVTPMSRLRERSLRFYLTPLAIGAVIALFLVCMVALGLTGVLWQNVTRRTREVGLRRAMGATASGVRRQILGEVAMLTTLAVVVGVAVAMQVPLLGLIPSLQLSTFAGGVALSLAAMYALTLLCGLYPSWLAARVEPATALHHE